MAKTAGLIQLIPGILSSRRGPNSPNTSRNCPHQPDSLFGRPQCSLARSLVPGFLLYCWPLAGERGCSSIFCPPPQCIAAEKPTADHAGPGEAAGRIEGSAARHTISNGGQPTTLRFSAFNQRSTPVHSLVSADVLAAYP